MMNIGAYVLLLILSFASKGFGEEIQQPGVISVGLGFGPSYGQMIASVKSRRRDNFKFGCGFLRSSSGSTGENDEARVSSKYTMGVEYFPNEISQVDLAVHFQNNPYQVRSRGGSISGNYLISKLYDGKMPQTFELILETMNYERNSGQSLANYQLSDSIDYRGYKFSLKNELDEKNRINVAFHKSNYVGPAHELAQVLAQRLERISVAGVGFNYSSIVDYSYGIAWEYLQTSGGKIVTYISQTQTRISNNRSRSVGVAKHFKTEKHKFTLELAHTRYESVTIFGEKLINQTFLNFVWN